MGKQWLESVHLDDGQVKEDCLVTTVAIHLGCTCEQGCSTQEEDMLWLQLVPPKKVMNAYM